jgi:hypothetical protein
MNFSEKRPPESELLPASRESSISSANPQNPDVLLTVELLQNQPQPFVSESRNIFQFVEKTPLPPPDPDKQKALQPQIPEVHYLGFYLEKSSDPARLAAISNGGKIYVGGPGDVLGGKYEILEVEDEFLVLKVLSSGKILRFPIGRKDSPQEVQR